MKNKWKGLFVILACILVLTACASSGDAGQEEITEDLKSTLFELTESTTQQMDEVVRADMIEEQADNYAVYTGLQSWASAIEEIGEVDFETDANADGIADCFTEKSVETDDDGNYIVKIDVKGSQKDAEVSATYDKDITEYVSLVTNVNYTSRELMEQAGMNTLLGMGTTFAVLILLSLIIALFGRIFTSSGTRKRKEKEKAEEEEEKRFAEQGATPPLEVVAVIPAAVAAYRAAEGQTDAFVVRRIRRVRKKR